MKGLRAPRRHKKSLTEYEAERHRVRLSMTRPACGKIERESASGHGSCVLLYGTWASTLLPNVHPPRHSKRRQIASARPQMPQIDRDSCPTSCSTHLLYQLPPSLHLVAGPTVFGRTHRVSAPTNHSYRLQQAAHFFSFTPRAADRDAPINSQRIRPHERANVRAKP